MQKALLIPFLIAILGGCDVAHEKVATPASATTAPTDSNVSNARIVTRGENSPIVVGTDAKVVIDGTTHTPAGQQLNGAPISAETHGKNSPVVVGNGSSVTITSK